MLSTAQDDAQGQSDIGRPFFQIGFWLFCLLIPVLILVVLSMWGGVYPFGPESFLTEDLKYQYIDFFTWFRHVLTGDANIFYSFAQGMGSNTWGLYSYYLASPFNLIILLFDEAHLTLAIYVIVAAKLACMNMSMAWYLRRRFELPRTWALTLALCYTWCTWTATNLRNPLWLDALILLPFLAWCCYRLIRKGSVIPLALVVAADVITCWYMAYITLLFSCLFVLFELAVMVFDEGVKPDWRWIAGRAVRFTAGILLGLGLSAWTFVPTILAMLGGGASPALDIPWQMTGRLDVIKGFLPAMWSLNTTPQFYAGLLPLILTAAFLISPRISRGIRLLTLLLIAFLTASALFGPLMYVWCGLRMPNGFYCRIAFLLSFMEIWAAGFHLMTRWRANAQAAVAHPEGKTLPWHTPNDKRPRLLLTNRFAIILIVVSIFDLGWNAHICWNQLYVGYAQADHDAYTSEAARRTRAVHDMDTDPFYRMDKTYNRAGAALNEGLSQRFNQLSTYSSANSPRAVAFLNAMGYSSPGEVSSAYAGPNLVMDSLLGVRYIDTWNEPPQSEPVPAPPVSNGADLFKNSCALSLGYPIQGDSSPDELPFGDNPFERQNNLFASITGIAEPIFTPLDATDNVDERSEFPSWTVEVPAGTVGYTYVLRPDGIDGYHPVTLIIDETIIPLEGWRFANNVRDLGPASPTTTNHTVSISPASGQTGIAEGTSCIFYGLNIELLSQAIQSLRTAEFSPTTFEDGYVAGTYHAERDTRLLLSIPYDTGWDVSINGAQSKLEPAFGGGMSTIEVHAGDSRIALTYRSPGTTLGVIASVISMAILATLFVTRLKGRDI